MSDIEYLAKKDFDSKLRENEGSRTTTGDLATLTAASGKDMYLAKAKVSVHNVNTGAAQIRIVTIELKVNGVIHETVTLSGGRTLNPSQAGPDFYEFVVSGVKVAATEIIKLEVVSITSSESVVEGVITCFEEDSGNDPVIT